MYGCSQYRDLLKDSFGIDLTKVDADIHPSKFCNPCYMVMRRSASENHTGVATTTFTWTKHIW